MPTEVYKLSCFSARVMAFLEVSRFVPTTIIFSIPEAFADSITSSTFSSKALN